MAQYSIETDSFLNTNRSIFETVFLANTTSGELISIDDPLPTVAKLADSEGNLITYDNRVPTRTIFSNYENMQLDGVERLRVSQAFDTWWYAPTIDKDSDYRYIESATGNNALSLFISNLASMSLSSGTDANGKFIRISRKRHKLRPTVSTRVSMSVNFNGYDSKITKRAGLFTNFNGIFWECKDDLAVVIRRRLADGSLAEKRVPRSAFNVDKLDGTTKYDMKPNEHVITANVTHYISTTTITTADGSNVYNVLVTVDDCSKFYPSLKGRITGITPNTFNQIVMVSSVSANSGSGNVAFTMLANPGSFTNLSSAKFYHDYLFHQMIIGFDFNGNRNSVVRFFVNTIFGRQVVHIEDFQDLLSTPWMNAPACSTRYEIFNNAIPDYRPSLLVSSETVTSESPESINPHRCCAYSNTGISYTTNTLYPVLGFSLRPGEPYQRATLRLKDLEVVDTGNFEKNSTAAFFRWELVLNPTMGGTVPTPINIGKCTRYWDYTSATTITGGKPLLGGFISSQSAVSQTSEAFSDIDLGANIEYTDSDLIVLTVTRIAPGTNASLVYGQINIIEEL